MRVRGARVALQLCGSVLGVNVHGVSCFLARLNLQRCYLIVTLVTGTAMRSASGHTGQSIARYVGNYAALET